MKTLLPLLLLFTTFSVGAAQNEPKKQEPATKPGTSAPEPSSNAYKLDFKIFELENGKRINERDFTLMAGAGRNAPPGSLRIGTRVPVSSPGEKPNYLDVGINIWINLVPQADKLAGSIRVEMTSLALPEQQGAEQRSSSPPVLRNTSFNADTVLVPGKPQLLSSIDDVNSKKRVQVEVVATKVE